MAINERHLDFVKDCGNDNELNYYTYWIKSKKCRKNTKTGKLNNCESILSNTPPWPGNNELASFTSTDLLIFDSNKVSYNDHCILHFILERQSNIFLAIVVFFESNVWDSRISTVRNDPFFQIIERDRGRFLATTGIKLVDDVFECCTNIMFDIWEWTGRSRKGEGFTRLKN